MKKRIVSFITVILSLAILIFNASACSKDNNTDKNNNPYEMNIEQVYKLAVDKGYTGTLEDLIEAFKGDKGDKGEDGITPEIGKDGYWYIGGVNTGILAGSQNKNTYSVNFELNGGSMESDTSLVINGIKFGETIDLPLPTKEGCMFLGWFTGNNVNDAQFTNLTPVSKTITLYARWQSGTDGLAYLESNEGYYVCGYFGDSQEVVIPDTFNNKPVVKILNAAFYNNTSINSIILPSSINSVGTNAFAKCTSLKSIKLGKEITQMGEYVFDNCYSLAVYVESETIPKNWHYKWDAATSSSQNPNVYMGVNSNRFINLNNCDYYLNENEVVLTKYYGNDTKITIPNVVKINNVDKNVAEIGSYAFNFSNLTEIKLPDNLTKINEFGFANCRNLKNLQLPDGIACLSMYAFNYCSELETIVLPTSLTDIEPLVFSFCNKLTVFSNSSSKPSTWSEMWNLRVNGTGNSCPVYWSGEWRFVDEIPTPNN